VSGGKSHHQTTKPGGLMVSDTQLCYAVVGSFLSFKPSVFGAVWNARFIKVFKKN